VAGGDAGGDGRARGGGVALGKCRPLSDSEIEAMKAHTPDVRDKCILIMLERTGYRSNEVASLKVDDVFDFSSKTIKARIQVKREHMKKKQGRRAIPVAFRINDKRCLPVCPLLSGGRLEHFGASAPAVSLLGRSLASPTAFLIVVVDQQPPSRYN
jgi:integrase